MIHLWFSLFFPREVTPADLGYLRERPGADGFRPPRRDLASEMAQGGSGRRQYPKITATSPNTNTTTEIKPPNIGRAL